MSSAIPYLLHRFGYRIFEFLRHWYVKSMKMYWVWVFDRLQHIDYTFAWKITLRHFFEPLYQDYSIIGYVVGILFRAFRLVITSAIYACIFALALSLYIVWLLLIPYAILAIFFR